MSGPAAKGAASKAAPPAAVVAPASAPAQHEEKAAPVAAAPSAPAPAVRYRVHAHGSLLYNGAEYGPGTELAIDEAEFVAMASSAVERFSS